MIENKNFLAWLNSECVLPDGYVRFTENPEVIRAVNVYADMVSNMTIHLMENGELGDKRINNALSRKVDIEPNPYMTRSTFYANIVRSMFFGDGNSSVLPVVTRDGLIDRFIPLDPDKTRYVADGEGYYVEYDRFKEYAHDEVLHFRMNPSTSEPWRGTGFAIQLKALARAISQSNATKESILQNPNPSLVIQVDSAAEELASEAGRKELSRRYLEGQKAGEPWFLPADLMTVHQINAMSINDLAIREDLELSKKDIAMLMGVPAYYLGVGDFNKDEHNHFIRTGIRKIAKIIEEELTKKILLKPEWYFKMNARSLMAYDLDELITAGGQMVDRTAMSRNEWRDWIGMSPRADMEELIVLENYLPIEQIGKQKKVVGNEDEV